jgi:hypothetical protein
VLLPARLERVHLVIALLNDTIAGFGHLVLYSREIAKGLRDYHP